MVKISVIVPVYNSAEYLNRCLESILKQTFKDFEVICINDGSTDNSLEILSDFAQKDNRIKIISQENKGIAATRNTGLDNSDGEYISFVDSDDYICENFLEELYNTAVKNSADIAVCGIVRVNKKGKKEPLFTIEKEATAYDFEDKLKLCDIPDHGYLWNKIYRREYLKIRFECGRFFEDILFLPPAIFEANKIVSVPSISYYYCRHSGSIINTPTTKSCQDRTYAQNKMKEFFSLHGVDISKLKTEITKHKFLGITVYKTFKKYNKTKHILFNFIKF